MLRSDPTPPSLSNPSPTPRPYYARNLSAPPRQLPTRSVLYYKLPDSPTLAPTDRPPSPPTPPSSLLVSPRATSAPWEIRLAEHRRKFHRSPELSESSSQSRRSPSFLSLNQPRLESPPLLARHKSRPIASIMSAAAGGQKRKVVIMGAPSVGKTSLTQQYIAPPTYTDQYYPTIEATSHKQTTYAGVEYDCEIIDSAGQDEYTLLAGKYATGVHGYVLVYSITSRQSFDMITTIHDKILDFAGVEQVPLVVVGQKSDLADQRQVSLAEGQALAKKLHGAFVESSAKKNDNVVKAFESLLGEMQKKYNPAPEKKKKGWFGW